jgi:hypothetical protein
MRQVETKFVRLRQAVELGDNINGWRVCGVGAGKHRGWPIIRIGQGSLQKDLGAFPIPRFRQVEVHRVPVAVDGAEQVHPAAGDPHKGFTHVPGGGLLL